jgi:RNA polymerase sigma factor (sigma-70 family)
MRGRWVRMNIFDKCIYLHKSIEADLEEIKRLRELAKEIPATDPAREFVAGGFNSGGRFAGLIDKAIDLETELADAIEEKLDYEREIYALLDELDPLSGLVLRMRYIEGLSIAEIAERLNLTERRIYDIKSRAIKKCEELRSISG